MSLRSDDHGNCISVTKRNGNGLVELKLVSERRFRKIGVIDYSMRVLYIKRKRSKHLHYKSGSYGFNHYLLDNASSFTHVQIKDEQETFLVSVKDLLEKGNFLYFLQQGFERQIFVTLDNLRDLTNAR